MTYLLVSNLLDKSVPVNGAIAAASGLLLGIFSMFATTLGLLITSLIQSVYIATCILYGVHEFVEVKNVFVAPTITLVVFVLLSVPIIKWPRVCSIIYICSFGAILMMLSVDFYADLSMLRLMAFENVVVRGEKTVRPCWFSWTVLALWPLMLFVGCVVQFLKTARDFDHRHGKLTHFFFFYLDYFRTLRFPKDILNNLICLGLGLKFLMLLFYSIIIQKWII